ncbi:MAG: hypothetical protein KDD09_25765, partial [Phaeodactylibacter sp.]|nr:hypothetical protein [Phaeodactylibacter sp.]
MDNNDNGTFDGGDMALAGVDVWLYAAGADYGVATPLAMTSTNANGYYYFDNLQPGTYVVYIPASNFGAGQPLENKESYPGADTGDTVDNNDNGQDTPVNGGIVSNEVTLTPNTEPTGEAQSDYPGNLDDDNVNGTVDFTFRTEKVAVGNYVFMDNNENGTYDVGDMGIANVTVELYAATQTPGVGVSLATTVTNADGYYYFDELNAGQYIVYIPAGNFSTGGALENKESYPGADAGDVDNNDNGQDAPANGGIASGVITLTPNAEPTNESGEGGSGTGLPAYPGTLD